MNKMENTIELLQNLITMNGALGEYSLALHLMVLSVGITVIIMMAAAIVLLRGESFSLIKICAKDILLGFGFAILVFTFPITLWLLMRAFWRAATWQVAAE